MTNPVTRFQILSKDPEAAARFYQSVFDWRIEADNALGYREISTGNGGIAGGIWPSPPEGHAFVQLFIEVHDVAKTLEDVVGKGGRVVIGPQKLPDGETIAIAHDPEGIPFGLVSS